MKQLLKEAEMAHSFSLTWTNQVAAAQRKRENHPSLLCRRERENTFIWIRNPKRKTSVEWGLLFLLLSHKGHGRAQSQEQQHSVQLYSI